MIKEVNKVKNKKDSLGDRMKNYYENRSRYYLTRRTPIIMRLDGNSFSNLTKKCKRPFDDEFIFSMTTTARYLVEKIQGAKCAYIQSDEISILITDFDDIKTEAWFDNNIQKIVSVSAGMASVTFSKLFKRDGIFDSRVFNLPKEEVCNYFIWRQKDWERNSLQMVARSYYSPKELYQKNKQDINEMLYQKGVNWSKLSNIVKRGTFLIKFENGWNGMEETPIFTKDRNSIEKFLYIKEDCND